MFGNSCLLSFDIQYQLQLTDSSPLSFKNWIAIYFTSNDHPWWRHQMETFSALLAICAGNSPVPGEFLAQRPVTRCFSVFFDLHLNIWLSKQSQGWWFETLPCPLWHHCNALHLIHPSPKVMADFFQTQKLKWCPHPICTIFGGCIKCM